VEVRNPHLQGDRLAVGEEPLLHFALYLGHHLLDSGGVDPSILDETLQGLAGDLSPDGLEAGEDDCLRRVVHDQVDASGLLEGADVAPLAADDPALHLVRRQIDDRDGALDHMVGRDALDGHRDDPPGALLAALRRLLLHPSDGRCGLHAGLVLQRPGQLGPRLLRGHPGDLLEAGTLLGRRGLELLLPALQRLVASGERDLELGHRLFALGDRRLALRGLGRGLVQPPFDTDEIEAVVPGLSLELGPRREQPFASLDLSVPQQCLSLELGSGQDRPAFLAGSLDKSGASASGPSPQDPDAGESQGDQRCANGEHNKFHGTPPFSRSDQGLRHGERCQAVSRRVISKRGPRVSRVSNPI